MVIKPIPQVIQLKPDENPFTKQLKDVAPEKVIVTTTEKETKYTYEKDHGGLWKFGMGLAAVFATLGTLFIGLATESIRNLWKKAISGKEIFIYKKDMLSPAAQATDQLFQAKQQAGEQIGKERKDVEQKRDEIVKQQADAKPQAISMGSSVKFEKGINSKTAPDDRLATPALLFYAEVRHKQAKGDKDYLPIGLDEINFNTKVEQFKKDPLNNWLRVGQKTTLGMSKEELKTVKENVEKRIELLDKTIQFHERIRMLEQTLPSLLPHIQMQDLEGAWSETGLRVALMDNHEYETFTLDQLASLNARQKELLLKRTNMVFLPPIQLNEETVTTENFTSLSLKQLRSLSSNKINELLSVIPPECIDFLSENQMQNLNVKKLSKEQLESYFRVPDQHDPNYEEISTVTEKRIKFLKVGQIYDLWDRLDEKRIAHLSEEQIAQLDFKEHRLTQKKFDALFPNYFSGISYDSKIRALSVQQILDCLNFFDSQRLDFIKPEQVAKINFIALEFDQRKKLVEGLFSYNEYIKDQDVRAHERLKALKSDQLNNILSLVDPKILSDISLEQFKGLDFKNLTKPQFNLMFNPFAREELLKHISKDQIKAHPEYFNEELKDLMSDEQLKLLV